MSPCHEQPTQCLQCLTRHQNTTNMDLTISMMSRYDMVPSIIVFTYCYLMVFIMSLYKVKCQKMKWNGFILMLYMEYNSYRGSVTFASTACKQDLTLFDCGMFIGAQKLPLSPKWQMLKVSLGQLLQEYISNKWILGRNQQHRKTHRKCKNIFMQLTRGEKKEHFVWPKKTPLLAVCLKYKGWI